jgi:type VI protein secretion system component Hcp
MEQVMIGVDRKSESEAAVTFGPGSAGGTNCPPAAQRRPAVGPCLLALAVMVLVATGFATAGFAGDVNLAWDASAQPEAAGYKIYYGTVSRVYGAPINAGNTTSYTVTGLAPGTYYFAVTAYSATGAESAYSAEISAVVSTTPNDTIAPVITGVTSPSSTASSALVTWTTDEPADGQVEFGQTMLYGGLTPIDTTLTTAHSITITGLVAGMTYHYRVKSRDAAGNLSTSGDFTFTTGAGGDTTPPAITAVTAVSITATGATVNWTTNEAADSQVEYGATTAYGSTTGLDTTKVTGHSNGLTGLTANSIYHYRVKSRDAAGNLATSGDSVFTTAPDTTGPTITGVTSSGVTVNSATITWTTNEAADTQVEYGTSTSYGTTTNVAPALVTSHSQALSGLTASTLYHYRAISKDGAGNLTTSADFTFTTTADTTGPTITGVTTTGVTGSSATVRWTTSEAADSQVQYGTTTSYGSTTSVDTTMTISHAQTISGLAANTTYNYRVLSRDAAGNLTTSGNFTFKTASAINLGLSAAYAFDEGTGSSSADFSGNGNTATLVNAGWTRGKFGNAVNLNGNNGYVTAGGAGLPAMNAPQTISYWISFNTKPTSTQPVVCLVDGAQNSLQPGFKESKLGVWQNPGSWLVTGTQPSTKTWHHVAYTYDGATHRLYVDGVEVSSSTIGPGSGAATSLSIGRMPGTSDFLKAVVDELRVYNRALSASEIVSLMTVVTGP